MEFYMAPLEGITGYVYRNAYHHHFAPFDKYFTPFVAPTRKAALSSKEKNDVLPEHNTGMYVVPQILSNNSKLFIMCAKNLRQQGYEEVNLNLGCPSGTVVTKNKGAGFLAVPDQLQQFLEDIFGEPDMPAISVKTRIGMEDPEEYPRIQALYNQYPLKELIIHPRLQKELYRGKPHRDVYGWALENGQTGLCYNGDIFQGSDYLEIAEAFPTTSAVMMGRGILQNPFLLEEIQSLSDSTQNSGAEGTDARKQRLYSFHEEILNGYVEIMPGEMPVLFKMKELWMYMAHSFDFGDEKERVEKKIKKAGSVAEYRAVAEWVFGFPLKQTNSL